MFQLNHFWRLMNQNGLNKRYLTIIPRGRVGYLRNGKRAAFLSA